MKKSTLVRTGVTAAIIAALMSTTPLAASAAPTTTNDGFGEARAFLTSHGVEAGVQDNLIAEYKAGGSWDSFSSNSKPVSTSTKTVDGYLENVSHFADGSVSVSRVEQPVAKPKGVLGTQSSPNSCTVSGSVRSNCNVDMWVGVVSMGFKASYNLSTNRVTNVYGAQWTIGGACSSSLRSLNIPTSNVGRMDINAQMCAVPYSTTFFLQVTVSKGVATESWSA
jgi:hypothetical protein